MGDLPNVRPPFLSLELSASAKAPAFPLPLLKGAYPARLPLGDLTPDRPPG